MRLTALEPDWRQGRHGNCAGLAFLCPGCGQHSVTLWLTPPLDGGAPEKGETLYHWDFNQGGLGQVTVFGPIDLSPCGTWRLSAGVLELL